MIEPGSHAHTQQCTGVPLGGEDNVETPQCRPSGPELAGTGDWVLAAS